MEILKGFQNNEHLRKSFNELARNTFGIDFETWYQYGYWTHKYIPYSFIDQGNVVANVSVNLIPLVIYGEVKQAVQIGTVMTHSDYRGLGLSRKLMELVLEEYKQAEFFYLFANQTVLNFYPKFGFEAYKEIQLSMEYSNKSVNEAGVRKLDGGNLEDLRFIYRFAQNRIPASKTFGTVGTEELLMFHCIMVFPQNLYFLEEEKALVIFKVEGNVLHLYDIVSSSEVNLLEILRVIAEPNINRVVFHFHLDHKDMKIKQQEYDSGNVLFVKKHPDLLLPEGFKHPVTSQA